MQTLSKLIRQFESVDVRGSVNASFKETEQDWIYLNLEELAKGYRSDGTKTARKGARYYPYAYETVLFKSEYGEGLGRITDRVTLYETGGFYAGFFAKIDGDEILTGSTDSKAFELAAFYNKEIFGVTKPNKRIYTFGPFWSVLRPKLGI